MSENNLKKEFSQRDVQRMRNIITGNTGDKTQIQAGWEKSKQVYREGDVWKQNGKVWTLKDGIKQTVTKLDEIKKLVVMPFSCPRCRQVIKITDLNKKMWSIHGKCFDCVIKIETEIKRQGKWNEYCANIMNRSKNAELDYLEQALEDWADESETFVSEQGDIEKWDGGDKKATYRQMKDEITELRKRDIYKGENPEKDAIRSQEDRQ